MSSGQKPTILLIETDSSLRRLISLGLQHRGMHVIEADSLEALAIPQPDLLLIDIDSDTRSDLSLLEVLGADSPLSNLPMVMLTWDVTSMASSVAVAQAQCVAKPFDARALYKAIDQLLAASVAGAAAAEARAEEMLLAGYSAHGAPSIWPLVTAIGLLLTVIGMLFQVMVTAAGILITVAALCLWVFDYRDRLIVSRLAHP